MSRFTPRVPFSGGPQLSRREMLRAFGIAGMAAASVPILSACGVGGGEKPTNSTSEVTGGTELAGTGRHEHQHPADSAPVSAGIPGTPCV